MRFEKRWHQACRAICISGCEWPESRRWRADWREDKCLSDAVAVFRGIMIYWHAV